MGQASSYRLTSLFQEAGRRLNIATTTRGRGPHFGRQALIGFGGRSAMSAFISWDGSDQFAHTIMDTPDRIDPVKLGKSGEITALVLTVLSRETDY